MIRSLSAPRTLLAAACLLFALTPLEAQERATERSRRAADKFAAPAKEPPGREFDFLHLRLECSLDWEKRSVAATVAHRARALRAGVRTLELDAVDIDVRSVRAAAGEELAVESLPGKLRIDCGRALERGEEIELVIGYHARPESGLYFQEPSAAHPQAPKQIWTQGETAEARHWLPCFDHPVDKLTSEVLVTAPLPLEVLSNGRLLAVEEVAGGRRFHWLQDKPHTTYLINVVAGEFHEWRSEAAGVSLHGYVEKRYAERAERTFGLTGDIIEFFNRRTGCPYPWDRYAQVCVYDFPFGGMENTSLTTLTDRTLRDEAALLDDSSMDLVAHELAHQWFGDLVTCVDWGEIWLNESFATFYANLYREHRLGLDEAVHEREEHARSYLEEDRNLYRRKLSTRNYRRSDDVFDEHAYPKGALILNMLRYVLGDDVFDAGVKLYLERHAFSTVETADFRRALEAASGQSLRWFFDQWVHAGGHPEYRVRHRWDAEERALTVEVEQTQAVDELTPLFRMPVVIGVSTASGREEHRVWIEKRTETISIPLAEKPLLVAFDPGEWILKEVDHEKSREEFAYQLAHDTAVMGRIRAARSLAEHATREPTFDLLARRLAAEEFWGARAAIVGTLGRGDAARAGETLRARFAGEPDARVRRTLVSTLGEVGGEESAATLREAFASDRSYAVRAAALRALGEVAGDRARDDALRGLEMPSFGEVIREAALEVLCRKEPATAESRADLVALLTSRAASGQPLDVRATAIRLLGRIGKGNERAFTFLSEALDDEHPSIRLAVFNALAELGDRRALEPLRRRREKERPRVFRDPVAAIDRAIAIVGGEDTEALRREVENLRRDQAELRAKVSELERRSGN